MLLDDEFLKAYEHGVVIDCCDGKKRRFYLRIFAYSADYPEKYIILRNMLLKSISNILESEFFSVAFETWVNVPVHGALSLKLLATRSGLNAIKISESNLPE